MDREIISFTPAMLFVILICFFLAPPLLYPQDQPFDPDRYSLININNWNYWQRSDGLSAANPLRTALGGVYPRHTASVLYADGFIWGGYVMNNNANPGELRIGGGNYGSGMQSGWITKSGDGINPPVAVDQNDPRARIYRVRHDIGLISNAELKYDARDFFLLPSVAEVTASQVEQLREKYVRDWQEWPADLGAPYYDRNRNGRWDPDFDEPGIVDADQVIWHVMNDAGLPDSLMVFDSAPVGLEVQVTLWAYKYTRKALGQTIFKRYRIINKSGFALDSLFIGQFSDPDLGDYSDDYVGCDTMLDLGYCYNAFPVDDSFAEYKLAPPAVGYCLVQGPVVPSPGHNAMYQFGAKPDYENLPMTSFAYTYPATGQIEILDYKKAWYNWLNGYCFSDILRPYRIGSGPGSGDTWQYGLPTKFPLAGNPATGSGDLDGHGNNIPATDRRMMLPTGPFSMQPGDTQEVVFALIGASSGSDGDNIESVAALQEYAPLIRNLYKNFVYFVPPEGPLPYNITNNPFDAGPTTDFFILGENYPNPFNRTTVLRYKIYDKMEIKLDIFNILGQKVKSVFNGVRKRGEYEYTWDGTTDYGDVLPSGIYLLRMTDNLRVQTKKVILVK